MSDFAARFSADGNTAVIIDTTSPFTMAQGMLKAVRGSAEETVVSLPDGSQKLSYVWIVNLPIPDPQKDAVYGVLNVAIGEARAVNGGVEPSLRVSFLNHRDWKEPNFSFSAQTPQSEFPKPQVTLQLQKLNRMMIDPKYWEKAANDWGDTFYYSKFPILRAEQCTPGEFGVMERLTRSVFKQYLSDDSFHMLDTQVDRPCIVILEPAMKMMQQRLAGQSRNLN